MALTMHAHSLPAKNALPWSTCVLTVLRSPVLRAQNTGGLQRLAASPVGSRVLQSCVKHGSAEQRKQILQELNSQLGELSKSPYAYHVVCKLVDTAPKEDLEGLHPISMLLRSCQQAF